MPQFHSQRFCSSQNAGCPARHWRGLRRLPDSCGARRCGRDQMRLLRHRGRYGSNRPRRLTSDGTRVGGNVQRPMSALRSDQRVSRLHCHRSVRLPGMRQRGERRAACSVRLRPPAHLSPRLNPRSEKTGLRALPCGQQDLAYPNVRPNVFALFVIVRQFRQVFISQPCRLRRKSMNLHQLGFEVLMF